MTDALLELKGAYLYLPSVTEMRETANLIEEKFKLANFAAGVDGIHMRFAHVSRILSSLVNKIHYSMSKCSTVQYIAGPS